MLSNSSVIKYYMFINYSIMSISHAECIIESTEHYSRSKIYISWKVQGLLKPPPRQQRVKKFKGNPVSGGVK